MINNFDLLKPLLATEENTGNLMQVIKRKKDGNDRSTELIDWEIWHPGKDWIIFKERTMIKCIQNNARAYINVNIIDLRLAVFKTVQRLLEDYQNKQYNMRKSILSVYGQMKAIGIPTWLIDVDNDEKLEISYKLKVPTPNGYHLLIEPFRLDLFREEYPGINVEKNNPTVLYVC